MALIQRPDLVEKARAQFGVVQGQVGATLSDELVGVVIIDDVTGPDVVSTQHPVNAIGSSSSAAGGATFFSKVGLQNPVNSGTDIFVDYALFTIPAVVNLTLRLGVIAASPNAGIKVFADERVVGNPVGIIWDENATVSLGTELIDVTGAALGMIRIDLGVTLGPANSIHAQNNTANQALGTVAYFWQERIRRE